MANYVLVRQKYLINHSHSSTAQARTILVTGIPKEFLTESALTRLFSHLPGGVRKVWINRNLGDMPELYNQRLKACQVLESASASLLQKAMARNRKRPRNLVSPWDQGVVISDNELTKFVRHRGTRETLLEETTFERKKVDTIKWACERIHKLNIELAQRRDILARDIAWTTRAEAEVQPMNNVGAEDPNIAVLGSILPWTRPAVDFSSLTYPPVNGAFVLFNEQISAHIAAQSLTHHEPYCMPYSLKYIEATPENVIWKNLTLNPYQRRVRVVISWTMSILLMIVWTIPVSATAIASRLQNGQCIGGNLIIGVCNVGSFGKVTTFIFNIFCAILLTVLFLFVPVMFRAFSHWEGVTQRTHVELILMNRVFAFNIINSLFLPALFTFFMYPVVEIAPNVWNADGPQTDAHASVVVRDLTASSTFFTIFIMLQGISGIATVFLQVVPLVKYYVNITLFGSTPRSVYSIKYCPRTSDLGSLFPSVTLLVVIKLGYSVVSPIINAFAFVTFFNHYMLYKYVFTWVNDHPPSGDTGGLFFPKAIHHVFVGLYVQQICLCVLFFFPLGIRETQFSAIPEGVLMIVLFVFTAFFHHIIHHSYGPLIKFLPQTFAHISRCENVGAEQGTHKNAGAPLHRTSSFDDDVTSTTDHLKASSSDSDQQPDKHAAQFPYGIDYDDIEYTAHLSFKNDPRASYSSPSARLTKEYSTDFGQPAATEEQRIIWLPKDPLGLVHEIEQELASHEILYSTEGAEMDSQGKVNVTSALPEEVQRAMMESRPRPCEREEEGKGRVSLARCSMGFFESKE